MSIFSRRKQDVKQTRGFHHIDRATIDRLYADYAPVFILSTGRSGSQFIARALGRSANACSLHEPPPTLMYFPAFAQRHQDDTGILRRMVDAARMELVLDALNRGKVYVESNQCLTFFADALAELFQGARFVHVIRDPRDFVVSAIRKGWHRNDSIWEAGRIRAADADWETMDQARKLAWLWQTTNEHLREFGERLPQSRFRTFRLEDLTSETATLAELVQFAGLEPIPSKELEQLVATPVNRLNVGNDEPANMRKQPGFPAFENWAPEDRAKLDTCTELAALYGYDLSES